MLRHALQLAGRHAAQDASAAYACNKSLGTLLQQLTCLGVPSLTEWRGAKTTAHELRPGNLVKQDGRLLHVVKSQYQQGAGRGHGVVHVEFKDIQSSNKVLQRLRPDDAQELVIMDSRAFQVLYREGELVHLMDNESFEQSAINLSVFGEQQVFVTENADVNISFYNNEPMTGEVPPTVVLTVREAPPVNEAKSGVMPKQVVLENGLRVQVPGYISAGDAVVIKTSDSSYVKKASL